MKKIKNRLYLLSLIALLSCGFVSCNSNVVFDKSESVSEKGWRYGDKKTFTVKIDEDESKWDYRFAINLTNTNDYKYNEIYFFVTTIYPDGSLTRRDTVECVLTNPDGSWKGKGHADSKDNRFWFARNVKLRDKGEYVFKIEQATRDTSLVGVKHVGLHIEKMPLN